ncbi:unnamed protein product [Durusdinium trenchii]|uniref:Uncharacterized protein n=1 Tax=Durusdinium trenchii TaxID=1381693 RepID=A0ABP0Q4M1_9DINO
MSHYKLCFKHRSGAGKRVRKLAAGMREDKKIHSVRGSRRSVTVLTTSWSDGTPGPIAFCVAEGHISGQDIVDYNLKNYGRSMVVTSGGSSHFMTGETMMIMMEQLISPALKLQRERHGLSDQDRAALLCDAWTGSFSKHGGLDFRRSTWFTSHNCEPPRLQPGGWSTHGQPVDSMHQSFRQEIRKVDLASTGHVCDLRNRARFEDLDIKASGQIAASVQNMRRVLELSLQAWNSIPIRVFQASWIVTGYFESSHFPPIDQTPSDIGAAQKVLDPAGVSGGSLPGTPQFCHKYEWQVQDYTPDEWHGLPYEIAHAIVRCVTMHGKAFLDAKRELHAQKQVDLSGKKPKTLKLKSAFEALHESNKALLRDEPKNWLGGDFRVVKHPCEGCRGWETTPQEGERQTVDPNHPHQDCRPQH